MESFIKKSSSEKRSGDLQRHVLHCAMATEVFVAKLRSDASTLCMLCHVPGTPFHCLSDCAKLNPLFQLLDVAFSRLEFTFSKIMFISGVKYLRQKIKLCTCLHFLIGQVIHPPGRAVDWRRKGKL